MHLDIRIPIGLLFTTLGVVLVGWGLLSGPAVYQRSLGYNVNLWWGLVVLLFGVIMLVMGRRGSRVSP